MGGRLIHVKQSEYHWAQSKHSVKTVILLIFLPPGTFITIIGREIGFGMEFRCQLCH